MPAPVRTPVWASAWGAGVAALLAMAAGHAQAGLVVVVAGFDRYADSPLRRSADAESVFVVTHGDVPPCDHGCDDVRGVPERAIAGLESAFDGAQPVHRGLGQGSVGLRGRSTVQFVEQAGGHDVGQRNRLALAARITSAEPRGTPMVLARLTYRNGDWFASSTHGPSFFDLSLAVSATQDPSLDGSRWNGRLRLDVAGAGGSDLLSFDGRRGMGSFRVASGQTGSVDLIGRYGSAMPLRFGNADGGDIVPASPVPEPSTTLTWAGGLTLLAALGRRRRTHPQSPRFSWLRPLRRLGCDKA